MTAEIIWHPRAIAQRDALSRPRWRAVATYRCEHGPFVAEWLFDELEELADLIELGPTGAA